MLVEKGVGNSVCEIINKCYIHILCIHTYMYTYIHIYTSLRGRERGRERKRDSQNEGRTVSDCKKQKSLTHVPTSAISPLKLKL